MAIKVEEHKEADAIQRARGFWLNNGKMLMYVGSAIIVILGAWLVYKYMVKIPKEEKRLAAFCETAAISGFSQFFISAPEKVTAGPGKNQMKYIISLN